MAEALISEVFKRPVLWDHRIKNYNMDFVDLPQCHKQSFFHGYCFLKIC